MSPEQVTDLQDFAISKGFEVRVINQDAFEANLDREYLRFSITVATSVLEWYTEVVDKKSALKYKSWFDYQGYDERNLSELTLELIEDVQGSFTEISQNKFRVKDKNICQKMVNDRWEYCTI